MRDSTTWRAWCAAGTIVVLCASTAGGQSFDYDRSRPLAVRDRGISLRDVVFDGPSGEPIAATLIGPARPTRAPAILFVHWYGPEHTNSNRTQYVPDALALAERGVVSLLVDTPWSEPAWFRQRKPEEDAARSAQQVRQLRRAMDVLAALDGVDPTRLAFVGHDFGAMYGAIVAALDPRVSAFAFVAGTARFADWFTFGRTLTPEAKAAVYTSLEPFDPVAHLPKAKARAVLLQFAKEDPYVTRAAADALIAAAPGAKEAKFYECGHEMSMDAMRDRVAWLAKTLGAAVPARVDP